MTQSTSKTFTTKWDFNLTETIAKNPTKNLTLNPNGPFKSDLTSTKVNLDPTFFQFDTKYNFVLNIIDSVNGKDVTVQQNWTLTMNAPPKGTITQLHFKF